VTGCGAVVLERGEKAGNLPAPRIAVTGITTGKMVDMGTKDSMNMGAAMAPAAWNTICQNLEDFGVDVSYYDRIITGDLGAVGQKVLLDFMKSSGQELAGRHMDCGLEIYDRGWQDVHAGGSGCGCAAVTLCAKILPKLKRGEWKRVLFVPTGALLSTVSYNEGQSIPGIAHAVVLERMEG
jgi:stage V sporulation protein AD